MQIQYFIVILTQMYLSLDFKLKKVEIPKNKKNYFTAT